MNLFRICILALFCLKSLATSGQERTVGVLEYDSKLSYDGYNLIYPHGQSNVYLLDNCGKIVHTWAFDDDKVPGNSVYLQEDGSIIRCSRNSSNVGDKIWAGGGGHYVESFNWEGELLWSFEQNDSLKRLHHDIEPMPNGNVLMISWEFRNLDECIDAGRDPENLFQDKLWPDYILEYDPILDSTVWEWHVWDHLVQDFDSSKMNYGSISENPQRIDINYENNLGNPDWNHINSIDYNATLDQILLSVPFFDEIWIIDHSTTLEEAKTHKGGRSGRGGDLLFRWGNPLTHRVGDSTDQKLFFQHDAHWIDDELLLDNYFYNEILIFNNRVGSDFSTANIIIPSLTLDTTNYERFEGTFLPLDFGKTILHPEKEKLYSSGLSSAQLLPNGNFLLLAGRIGRAFEISPENSIVWDFILPFKMGDRIEQGEELNLGDNNLFRVKRYPIDFMAFMDRDLQPIAPLHLGDDSDICSPTNTTEMSSTSSWHVHKNPTNDFLEVSISSERELNLKLYDISGRLINSFLARAPMRQIDLSNLRPGIYLLSGNNGKTEKVVRL